MKLLLQTGSSWEGELFLSWVALYAERNCASRNMGGSVIQEWKGMCFFWKISKQDAGDPPEKSWEVTARLMQLRRLHLPLLPCQVLLEEPQDPARVYANVFSRHFFSLSESLHKTWWYRCCQNYWSGLWRCPITFFLSLLQRKNIFPTKIWNIQSGERKFTSN